MQVRTVLAIEDACTKSILSTGGPPAEAAGLLVVAELLYFTAVCIDVAWEREVVRELGNLAQEGSSLVDPIQTGKLLRESVFKANKDLDDALVLFLKNAKKNNLRLPRRLLDRIGDFLKTLDMLDRVDGVLLSM